MKKKIFFITFLLLFYSTLSNAAYNLVPIPFSELKGWKTDEHRHALYSFLSSCQKLKYSNNYTPNNQKHSNPLININWNKICKNAYSTFVNKGNAKSFFETNFIPALITQNFKEIPGFYTGYYIPTIKGNLVKTEKYKYPIYKYPGHRVNLTRQEINEGALASKNLELLWTDDPVDLFFLHIQGSGKVEFDDGSTILVGFAGKNNKPYSSVGKYLKNNTNIAKSELTSDGIKNWLRKNSHRAKKIMEHNESYIFFKINDKDYAVGGQDVKLTSLRSLAIDKKFIPYGLPIWVGTGDFSKLMIAQDTGSDIKGVARADIFFGYGQKAGSLAGRVKEKGQFIILIPRS